MKAIGKREKTGMTGNRQLWSSDMTVQEILDSNDFRDPEEESNSEEEEEDDDHDE